MAGGNGLAWRAFSELCEATGEGPDSVEWLANRGQFARHYRTTWVPKRHGRRLLEAPLARLEHVQRTILRDVLEPAPMHSCAMGFRKGQGTMDHAEAHAGRRWIVTMDLQDFFATISASRVASVFR